MTHPPYTPRSRQSCTRWMAFYLEYVSERVPWDGSYDVVLDPPLQPSSPHQRATRIHRYLWEQNRDQALVSSGVVDCVSEFIGSRTWTSVCRMVWERAKLPRVFKGYVQFPGHPDLIMHRVVHNPRRVAVITKPTGPVLTPGTALTIEVSKSGNRHLYLHRTIPVLFVGLATPM